MQIISYHIAPNKIARFKSHFMWAGIMGFTFRQNNFKIIIIFSFSATRNHRFSTLGQLSCSVPISLQWTIVTVVTLILATSRPTKSSAQASRLVTAHQETYPAVGTERGDAILPLLWCPPHS